MDLATAVTLRLAVTNAIEAEWQLAAAIVAARAAAEVSLKDQWQKQRLWLQ